MKRGRIVVLVVGLALTGCSGTADDGPSADTAPSSMVATTAEATTSTVATTTAPATTAVTTTTGGAGETTAARRHRWPGPIAFQAAIYDSVADSIFLFGGTGAGGFEVVEGFEVFELDVATMTFVHRSDMPYAYLLSSIPVAYDEQSDTIVALDTGYLRDEGAGVWTYNPTTDSWSEVSRDGQSTVGAAAMMAYDSESDLIVAYRDWGEPGDGTWVYDADTNTWTDMAPVFHPVGVDDVSFVYDEQSDLIVLYGTTPNTDNGSLWTYDVDANTWTELDITGGPAVPPGAIQGFYHPPTDRIVYFGGAAPDASTGDKAYNDVWAYDVDANTWTELAPNPITGLMFHSFTYVPTLDRAVAFGGSPDFSFAGGNRLLVYDPVADSWEEILPPPRSS